MFGLAYWPNYHYYRGHVMWDIETFALPPLLLAEPESAKAILDYRHRHLDAAQINARFAGWKGAMYPWESCPMHGEEVTPGSSAPTKGHATLDVALAFASFVHATGDRDYLRRTAWPVIHAVAEWTESRVDRTRRGYEIREITGPAEADPPRNNNAFVNMAAGVLMREAIGFAEALGEEPRPSWRAIADGLVLPAREPRATHPELRRLPDRPAQGGNARGRRRHLPGWLPGPAAPSRRRPSGTPSRSRRRATSARRCSRRSCRTTRPGPGCPAQAAELLETGYGNFINEPFHETDEFSNTAPDQPRTGPMFANIGGFLTTLLYGYPGLRLGPGEPETWADRPVVLPAGWKAIHVERLWVRGEGREPDGRRRSTRRRSSTGVGCAERPSEREPCAAAVRPTVDRAGRAGPHWRAGAPGRVPRDRR